MNWKGCERSGYWLRVTYLSAPIRGRNLENTSSTRCCSEFSFSIPPCHCLHDAGDNNRVFIQVCDTDFQFSASEAGAERRSQVRWPYYMLCMTGLGLVGTFHFPCHLPGRNPARQYPHDQECRLYSFDIQSFCGDCVFDWCAFFQMKNLVDNVARKAQTVRPHLFNVP